MTTFADYFAEQLRNDRTALYCTGLCYRRKPRDQFRETAWHGRAARCRDCEGGRAWDISYNERQAWLLEQERARTRMLRRHITRLNLRLLMATAPTSADALRCEEKPLLDKAQRISASWRMTFLGAMEASRNE